MSYQQLADWWRVFNRAFVLIYSPERTQQIAAILHNFGIDETRMWVDAEVRARTELASHESDAFAWFHLGSSLIAAGRADEAVAAFDQAHALGLPPRMLWYQFGPLEAYLAVSRPQDVLELTDEVVDLTESTGEIYYWRARALLATGDGAGAREAVQHALSLAPDFAPAVQRLSELDGA